MSNLILALWFALIGADRIDLLGGHGPFILTPFLALTPVVVLSELLRRYRVGRRIDVSRQAIAYAFVACALLSLALASVFIAANTETSFSRAMLIVGDFGGTFTIALLCLDRRDLMRVLAHGVMAALVAYFVFDVIEALWWIGRAPEILRFGTATVQFGQLQNAGPYPRLAGPVADGNRGGFVLLFYFVVLGLGVERRWLRHAALTFAMLLLVATLSRSAFLGGIAMVAVGTLTRRQLASPSALLAGALVVACASALLLVSPRALTVAERVFAPFSARLSTKEGSATSHLVLIERGLDEATASVDRSIRGFGFGDSYLVLQDVFSGSRYGNFHSLYVTIFAEAGVFALLASLILTLMPVVAGGPLRAMVAGAIGFNLFYQSITEPAFWFMLALAWMTLSLGADAPDYGAFWTRRLATRLSPLNSTIPSTKLDPRPSTME